MIRIVLDIQRPLAAWSRIPRLGARLQKAAQAVAERASAPRTLSASATVLLAGNARVRQLNCDFRGIDKATNVLSFPQFSRRGLGRQKAKTAVELGDIALAYQYVVAEAKKEGKPLPDHVTHLVIHGLLHLLGYDHGNEKDASRMERKEIEIMKALGLPDPYAPYLLRNKAKTHG